MSQAVHAPTKSFPAGAALAANRRVKLASGVLQYAGASDVAIGVLEAPTFADANYASGYSDGTVRLRTAEGTHKVCAVDAITAANSVYAAANGKVSATGTIVEGKAFETSALDGDVIEVMATPNTDIAAAITGTTAAAFAVDSDSSTPKIALAAQTGGTGDYTTTLKPETTLSGDNAIIVPEADGDTLVAVALAQTLTNKTLTSPIHTGIARQSHTVSPVAAAGTTVADAGQLGSTNITHITSDGAAKGVKLPAVAAGDWGIVINNSATAAEFYAASGGTVNGLSADASVVIPASKGLMWFATGTNTVIAFDMPAKATAS